LPERGDA